MDTPTPTLEFADAVELFIEAGSAAGAPPSLIQSLRDLASFFSTKLQDSALMFMAPEVPNQWAIMAKCDMWDLVTEAVGNVAEADVPPWYSAMGEVYAGYFWRIGVEVAAMAERLRHDLQQSASATAEEIPAR